MAGDDVQCPRCGAPLSVPGHACPACLLRAALIDQAGTSSLSPDVADREKDGDTMPGPSAVDYPDRIGPYRILEELGEGGMGTVYLAEQEVPLRRRVAIKVVKLGMDTREVISRFEAERQALAIMSHPAIAQVFDAGSTPQGRPFFAMEYVPGEAITSYCNRHNLTTHQRIALFLEVCDGVQHAHQKGIIHRDLKPSNILISERNGIPVPKIIDFGLAKAITLSLTQQTLHTQFGALLGTPEYVSPEQAEFSVLDVDTRIDVYALGTILYELLTGVLPFDGDELRHKSLREIQRTIREVEPLRPSTRVASVAASGLTSPRPDIGAIPGELKGDLDWITMRALEKDRARRYGSASDLAADLRRHLEHQPVSASPPSALYRVRKFARRHRAGVAVGALVFVFVTALAGIMTLQAGRIARERDRANLEATTATQVSEFLASLFRVSDPGEARGNSLTAREVLDNGARRIEKELAGQPEIQGRLMAIIGDVYSGLGLYAQAESVLARSLEIRGRALGQESLEAAASAHKLAAVFGKQLKAAQAEPLIRKALDVRRRVLGPEHPDTVTSLSNLANLFFIQENLKQAEVYMRETLDIRRRTLGNDAPDTLDSLNNLADVVSRSNMVEAEAYVREAVTRSRRVQGQDHPRTLAFLRHLASLLNRMEKYHEAELGLREVLDAQQRVLGTDHPESLETRNRLGSVLRLQGKLSEAETEWQEVLKQQQRADLLTLQTTLQNLGMLRIAQGRYGEAEKLGRQGLTINTGEFGKLSAMVLVGRSLLGQGRFEAAEPFLLESYSGHVRTKSRAEELETVKLIVDLYERWQRPDKAAEWRAKLPK